MAGRNTNIYFPEETYNKLKQVAGVKISRFVSEAVEEKIARTEKKEQEEFQKMLIVGYKRIAKNKKIQKGVAIWDETLNDVWLKPTKTKKDEK